MRREAITARAGWQHKVEQLDFNWHTIDGEPYWAEDRCYNFTSAEIDGLEAVTAELHGMALQAVDKVVKDRLWDRFLIPPAFAAYIETTWRRRDPTIYGRFDLLYDGTGAPKLLEYNADTPTALYEAAVVQWYWLQDVKPRADQFNSIHERLIEAWKGVLELLPTRRLVHFACDQEAPEDFGTTEYMRDVAHQAGLDTQPIALADVGWNGSRFTDLTEQPIQALFKLYPWEWLLRDQFAEYVGGDTTAFIEPAWKMILSNKALLPLLWEMFPDHDNLLPAYRTPGLIKGDYVKKPIFGREGANVSIVAGAASAATDGPYGDEGFVYQAYQPIQPFDGFYPVIGSWVIAGQPAGIGIREDRQAITGNTSRFVPHYFA